MEQIISDRKFVVSCHGVVVKMLDCDGLIGFPGISTIVGYFMLNPFNTYILNIQDLIWLGFMAYQQL